ncbi:MAG TPA: hypothetical protein VFY66_02915, partial [Anaerolineales bacterium]|nr:hypothetical protein [Anaerolineales bacterium]
NQSFRDFSHNLMKRDNAGVPTLVEGAAKVEIGATKEQGKINVTVTVTVTLIFPCSFDAAIFTVAAPSTRTGTPVLSRFIILWL